MYTFTIWYEYDDVWSRARVGTSNSEERSYDWLCPVRVKLILSLCNINRKKNNQTNFYVNNNTAKQTKKYS